jgi:hypothetical protein
MAKWEERIEIETDNDLSDLEKLVMIDMLDKGYDYLDQADIQEYWREKLT